ncbi:MAG: hypothetical protein ACI3XU_09100 [Butyricicoccaceae bacterium]
MEEKVCPPCGTGRAFSAPRRKNLMAPWIFCMGLWKTLWEMWITLRIIGGKVRKTAGSFLIFLSIFLYLLTIPLAFLPKARYNKNDQQTELHM